MSKDNFLIGSTLFTNTKNINNLLNQSKNEIVKTVENISTNVQNEIIDKKEKIESEIGLEVNKSVLENEIKNVQNEIKNDIESKLEEKKDEIEKEIRNTVQTKINSILPSSIELNKIKSIQDGLQASLQHFQNGMSQMNEQYSASIPTKSRNVSQNNSRKPSVISNGSIDDIVIDIPQSQSDLPQLADSVKIVTTRNRKIDRKNLANDILAELPISFRVNDSILIDNNETLENYIDEWKNWNTNGQNKLDILIERINIEEQKYKDLSKFNIKCAKSIQFCLLALGSIIVYIQASGGDSNLINKFTIASGAGTTIASSVLTYFGFPKKGPHYGKVYSNLNKLKCWIDSKLVLPIEKRFSPYDIYAIAKKAFDTIIFEAKDGLQDHK
jgi:hypothetical protein